MKKNVFVSYAEEDSSIALEFAKRLEDAGYSTWFYERDAVPGVPYLLLTGKVIEDCNAILLIISKASVPSHQITREVERAHEAGKIFIPVLLDISHEELKSLQPIWRQAIGTHASITLPLEGPGAVIPHICQGLQIMGVIPDGGTPSIELSVVQTDSGIFRHSGVHQLPDGLVVAERDRSFVYGYKPPTRGVYGRSDIVEECMQPIVDRRLEFLCLYGPGGIGKSTIAALTFSRFLEEKHGDFTSHIWYDLRSGPDPETALLLLANIATDGNVPSGGKDTSPFDMWLDILRVRLAENPILIVFDNLDSAFDLDAEAGTFTDDRWPRLFRTCLDSGSTIIVTSYQLPKFHYPRIEFRQVDGIESSEAVNLMRDAGLKDENEVLEEAHRLLGGHPMALRALAAAVLRRPTYRARLSRAGDIMDAVRRCPDKTLNPVAFFEEVISPERLPSNEYRLITAMTVLHRMETADAIGALAPEINQSDVPFALDELYLRSLVHADIEADPPRYSLSPLVKGVAETGLDDPIPIHENAYNYYTALEWDSGTHDPLDVEHFRLAVLHALALKDLDRANKILYGDYALSNRLLGWGRYDLALPLHKKELECAREVGSEKDQMLAAGLLSRCHTRVGRLADALELAEEALFFSGKLGDRKNECTYRRQVGRIHLHAGDFDKSFELLQEALGLADETGDRREDGAIRNLIGQICVRRGDYDDALELLEKALEIATEYGDRTNEIDCRGTIGQIYFQRGDYNKALTLLMPAHDLAKAYGDRVNESKLGILIGQVQMWKGSFGPARQQFERTLAVSLKIGNRRHEGALLAQIAKIHMFSGNHTSALELLEQSLNIAVELASKAAEAFRRGQIGEVYLATGEYDKALECFNHALDFAVGSKNRTNECVWQGKIGEVHLNRGELDAADEWLRNALDIALELKDKENESEWTGKLGCLYLARDDYDKAREYLEKALGISSEIVDPVNERSHRIGLGRLFLASGKPCDAVPHFKEALEITRKLGMVKEYVEKAEGDLAAAIKECETQ